MKYHNAIKRAIIIIANLVIATIVFIWLLGIPRSYFFTSVGLAIAVALLAAQAILTIFRLIKPEDNFIVFFWGLACFMKDYCKITIELMVNKRRYRKQEAILNKYKKSLVRLNIVRQKLETKKQELSDMIEKYHNDYRTAKYKDLLAQMNRLITITDETIRHLNYFIEK